MCTRYLIHIAFCNSLSNILVIKATLGSLTADVTSQRRYVVVRDDNVISASKKSRKRQIDIEN